MFFEEMKVISQPISRREMLARCGVGMGLVGLAPLLAQGAENPLAVKAPHFKAKAKRIIHIFANGGPSHVDTFDPKPKLTEYAGKPLPFEMPKLVRTKTGNLLASPWKFANHGR